jgi:hypothetical protein
MRQQVNRIQHHRTPVPQKAPGAVFMDWANRVLREGAKMGHGHSRLRFYREAVEGIGAQARTQGNAAIFQLAQRVAKRTTQLSHIGYIKAALVRGLSGAYGLGASTDPREQIHEWTSKALNEAQQFEAFGPDTDLKLELLGGAARDMFSYAKATGQEDLMRQLQGAIDAAKNSDSSDRKLVTLRARLLGVEATSAHHH